MIYKRSASQKKRNTLWRRYRIWFAVAYRNACCRIKTNGEKPHVSRYPQTIIDHSYVYVLCMCPMLVRETRRFACMLTRHFQTIREPPHMFVQVCGDTYTRARASCGQVFALSEDDTRNVAVPCTTKSIVRVLLLFSLFVFLRFFFALTFSDHKRFAVNHPTLTGTNWTTNIRVHWFLSSLRITAFPLPVCVYSDKCTALSKFYGKKPNKIRPKKFWRDDSWRLCLILSSSFSGKKHYGVQAYMAFT